MHWTFWITSTGRRSDSLMVVHFRASASLAFQIGRPSVVVSVSEASQTSSGHRRHSITPLFFTLGPV